MAFRTEVMFMQIVFVGMMYFDWIFDFVWFWLFVDDWNVFFNVIMFWDIDWDVNWVFDFLVNWYWNFFFNYFVRGEKKRRFALVFCIKFFNGLKLVDI
jgi:hypothetical protein